MQKTHGFSQRAKWSDADVCLQQQLSVGLQVTLELKTSDRYGRTMAEVIGAANIDLLLVAALPRPAVSRKLIRASKPCDIVMT